MRRDRAVERTLEDARAYGDRAKAALDVFDPSPLRDDLRGLVDYVVDRDH